VNELKMKPVTGAVSQASSASSGTERPERQSKRERLARLTGQAIFFCSLLLMALAAIPYGSVEFWWTSFFELGVFALTALWAFESLLGQGFRLGPAETQTPRGL